MNRTRLKMIVLSFAVMLGALGFVGGAGIASADTAALKTDACNGLSQLGQDCNAKGESPVTKLIAAIVTILSWVVGVASIIVIIIAGLKYVTSAGDTGSVASAKTTLIYALVGLVVAALAQFLVHFVLHHATAGAMLQHNHIATVVGGLDL